MKFEKTCSIISFEGTRLKYLWVAEAGRKEKERYFFGQLFTNDVDTTDDGEAVWRPLSQSLMSHSRFWQLPANEFADQPIPEEVEIMIKSLPPNPYEDASNG